MNGSTVVKVVLETFSSFDSGNRPSDETHSERFYHGFVLGMVVSFSDRYEGTLEETLTNAHRQIDEKKYETELVSRGFSPERIRKYGFAFRGKECLIG